MRHLPIYKIKRNTYIYIYTWIYAHEFDLTHVHWYTHTHKLIVDTENHNTFPNCLWNYWQPRLAVWALLQADPGNCFALIAVVCTSWCHINSGTHRRSVLFPEGRTELGYVRSGNEMMSRILVGQSFIYIYVYSLCGVFQPEFLMPNTE